MGSFTCGWQCAFAATQAPGAVGPHVRPPACVRWRAVTLFLFSLLSSSQGPWATFLFGDVLYFRALC